MISCWACGLIGARGFVFRQPFLTLTAMNSCGVYDCLQQYRSKKVTVLEATSYVAPMTRHLSTEDISTYVLILTLTYSTQYHLSSYMDHDQKHNQQTLCPCQNYA